MEVELVPAAQADVVQNLFPLYAHDLSEYTETDVSADGRFPIPDSLPEYWSRSPATFWPPEWRGLPYLLRVAGELVGFALVRQTGPGAFDMGEFFVLRKYRRLGVGRGAARKLFEALPGSWEVRELPKNTPAQAFWRQVIAEHTRGDFTETRAFFDLYQREFVVQRFITPSASA
jgi:predicted acetyltransferase